MKINFEKKSCHNFHRMFYLRQTRVNFAMGPLAGTLPSRAHSTEEKLFREKFNERKKATQEFSFLF